MAVTDELRDAVLLAVSTSMTELGYDVQPKDIMSKERPRQFVYARRIAAYILRNSYGQTVVSIGRSLGIDHATVIYNCNRFVNDAPLYRDLTYPYMMAVKKLDCEVPEWLSELPMPKELKPNKRNISMHRLRWTEENDGYVRPINWTKKQRETLDHWRKEGAR